MAAIDGALRRRRKTRRLAIAAARAATVADTTARAAAAASTDDASAAAENERRALVLTGRSKSTRSFAGGSCCCCCCIRLCLVRSRREERRRPLSMCARNGTLTSQGWLAKHWKKPNGAAPFHDQAGLTGPQLRTGACVLTIKHHRRGERGSWGGRETKVNTCCVPRCLRHFQKRHE